MTDVRPIGGPASAAAGADQERRLREVAEEFEALFMRTLLRSMRSTVMESDLLNPQGDTKYYRQLYDEELARRTAGRGGLGIAELVVRQYRRQRSAAGEALPAAPDQRRAPVQGPPTAAEARRAYAKEQDPAGDAVRRARSALMGATRSEAADWRLEAGGEDGAAGTDLASGGSRAGRR